MTGGTTLVDDLAEWSLDFSMDVVDVTAFTDQWGQYIPSIRNATGSFSGNFTTDDTGQTSLQNAALGGSAVALRLYLNTTKYYNIGTAYLTGMGASISQTGKADVSFDFQAASPVTLV